MDGSSWIYYNKMEPIITNNLEIKMNLYLHLGGEVPIACA